MIIRRIIDAIEDFAPRALQENYDNSGMQAGDAANDCTGALLTLDVSERTVAEAAERGCNLIISHHPLLFKGVKSVTPSTKEGRILLDAIRRGVAIYAAHTSLDNARYGVSSRMAVKLGLSNVRPLCARQNELMKIVVFVPESAAESVRTAIADAGAGMIGDYDRCSYSMRGIGRYRANEGARPFAGQVGCMHEEPEERIEAVVEGWRLGRVVEAMLAAHPYEEPAYDVIVLSNEDRHTGCGAVGNVEPIAYGAFLSKLKTIFGCPAVRCCGDLKATVRTVALCGGSGAPMIADAVAAGADVYVTGDMKYHDFTTFCDRISIADIGHYESEQCAKEILADVIRSRVPEVAVYFAESDENVIKYI